MLRVNGPLPRTSSKREDLIYKIKENPTAKHKEVIHQKMQGKLTRILITRDFPPQLFLNSIF